MREKGEERCRELFLRREVVVQQSVASAAMLIGQEGRHVALVYNSSNPSNEARDVNSCEECRLPLPKAVSHERGDVNH